MIGREWTPEEDAILRAGLAAGEQRSALSRRLEAAGYPDRSPSSVEGRLKRPTFTVAPEGTEADFEVEELPSETPTADEVRERRKAQFARKAAAKEARRLISVRVKLSGQFGIMHMGDPHVDDDGTDIALLERHVEIAARTKGMLVGNVGDYQNNWVGRLARLYGEQSTSAAEAWVLTEWLVRAVPWLYLIGGNHDAWSGAGDPLKWIARQQGALLEPHGARLGLELPCGRVVRVNARHQWPGSSQWNPAHGVGKAIQMGVRDHIVTCGHTHVSGFMPIKDPTTGLISHGIQVASYKTFDRYAEEKGLRDQATFVAPVSVIDPRYADDDPRFLSIFFDPEHAADYLTFVRRKAA